MWKLYVLGRYLHIHFVNMSFSQALENKMITLSDREAERVRDKAIF